VRSEPATGLAEIRIDLGPESFAAVKARSTQSAANGTGGFFIRDPWGTAIVLVPVPSHSNQGEPA
jgi:hypothetical protein